MPYQFLLDRLVSSVHGAQGALLMDNAGEVVVEAGARDDRHRLIAAYQGIGLARAQRTSERYQAGEIEYVLCRYAWGQVIMRPLKDGYYLIISLAPDANVGLGLHRSAEAKDRLNREL